MKVTIKPEIIRTGKGVKRDAIRAFEYAKPGYCMTYGSYGEYYSSWHNKESAVFYTMQIYKRRKHRKDKHYELRIYNVPFSVLKYFDLEVSKGKTGFKLVKKKKS